MDMAQQAQGADDLVGRKIHMNQTMGDTVAAHTRFDLRMSTGGPFFPAAVTLSIRASGFGFQSYLSAAELRAIAQAMQEAAERLDDLARLAAHPSITAEEPIPRADAQDSGFGEYLAAGGQVPA